MIPKTPGTALVTGGAQRIGKDICLALAKKGFNIALHCNQSQKQAELLQKSILQLGVQCKIFRCDLSSYKQTDTLISKVFKSFPDLSLLINNASMFQPSKMLEEKDPFFQKTLNVNFFAPYFLTKQFALNCSQGHIINMLDANYHNNNTSFFSYQLSKKMLKELTLITAKHIAPTIRVNAIAPGPILPPSYLPKTQRANYDMEKHLSKVPIQKVGQTEHIISSLFHLIANDYITGQILFVDGGTHLG